MSSHEQYVDITLDFQRACNELKNGEYIAQPNFRLSEAVSTFEVGDPSFDKETIRAKQPHQAYNVTNNLAPAEIIEIMYHILRLQSTWIAGCQMSQSIFTCHYIHNILEYYDDTQFIRNIHFRHIDRKSQEDSSLDLLRLYCILVIKVVWGVNGLIKNCGIPTYEEGEHIWQTHGKSLLGRIDMQAIFHGLSLDLFDSIIEAHMGDFKVPAKALMFLQWDFLLALSDPSKTSDHYCFQYVPGYLNIIKEHLSKYDDDANRTMLAAFQTDLSERYPPLTPPREIKPHGISEIVETFSQIQKECETILLDIGRGDFANPVKVFSLRQYLYSKNHEHCKADLFIRTFGYWTISTQGEGIWIDRIIHEIWQIAFYEHPAFLRSEHSDEHSTQKEAFRKCILEFVERARGSESFLTMYSGFFVNRSRMRREFARVIKGLGAFMPTAREYDRRLQMIAGNSPGWSISPSPLIDWVRLTQLWVAQYVLELGFELKIYDFEEYDYLIRYLYQVVSVKKQFLDRYILPTIMRRLPTQQPSNTELDLEHLRTILYSYGLAEVCIYDHAATLWNKLWTPENQQTEFAVTKSWSLRMRPFKSISNPAPEQTSTLQQTMLPHTEVTKCFEEGLFLRDLTDCYPTDVVKQWDFNSRSFPFFKVDFRKNGVFEDNQEVDLDSAFPS